MGSGGDLQNAQNENPVSNIEIDEFQKQQQRIAHENIQNIIGNISSSSSSKVTSSVTEDVVSQQNGGGGPSSSSSSGSSSGGFSKGPGNYGNSTGASGGIQGSSPQQSGTNNCSSNTYQGRSGDGGTNTRQNMAIIPGENNSSTNIALASNLMHKQFSLQAMEENLNDVTFLYEQKLAYHEKLGKEKTDWFRTQVGTLEKEKLHLESEINRLKMTIKEMKEEKIAAMEKVINDEQAARKQDIVLRFLIASDGL